MAVKSYNPTSPSRRNMMVSDFAEITVSAPEKSLVKGKSATGGRNNYGRITTRFRGAGNKRRYRMVDFFRAKEGVPAKVKTVEYDPNRNCNVALICYADGEKSYILAPAGIKIGQVIMNGPKAEIKPGNSMRIKDMPVGIQIHNIEILPNRGAKLARSAGQSATLRGKEADYAQLKLASGEVRLINVECRATIGEVGNGDFMNVKMGKAGKKRYQGKRPHVRGVAMNPVDHPMGGGEGRSSGGGHPVSPWGQLAKGKRTRHPKKYSNKFIVERRKK
ncbi:50S ribosomal protein L2 [Victivallis sp. Marseille-Q1083]|uniref:50S ribosomal protein L2 n=1 Tax=Victivallis sp. Marseille-Q1083 TaxID=2717288 RepID=UPI00158ED94D|nr:50S ribosomal protein L2 [Victivallis sp. Marseille-Q1083]